MVPGVPAVSKDYIRSLHLGKDCYQPLDCNSTVIVLYKQPQLYRHL